MRYGRLILHELVKLFTTKVACGSPGRFIGCRNFIDVSFPHENHSAVLYLIDLLSELYVIFLSCPSLKFGFRVHRSDRCTTRTVTRLV